MLAHYAVILCLSVSIICRYCIKTVARIKLFLCTQASHPTPCFRNIWVSPNVKVLRFETLSQTPEGIIPPSYHNSHYKTNINKRPVLAWVMDQKRLSCNPQCMIFAIVHGILTFLRTVSTCPSIRFLGIFAQKFLEYDVQI